MKILYIEDNLIDRKNMEWVCRNFAEIDLTILKKFDELKEHLSQHQPDIIFTDRRIGNQEFSQFEVLWTGIPYYVLSNITVESSGLSAEPIAYLQKPLTKSKLQELLFTTETAIDTPNMDYFAQIPDEDLQKEMKNLLKEELLNAHTNIPQMIANKEEQINELISKVHNLAGKFSLLGMEVSFNKTKQLEKELRQGTFNQSLLADVMKSIETGMQFLN